MDYTLMRYCLLYWSRSLKFCRKAALSGTELMTPIRIHIQPYATERKKTHLYMLKLVYYTLKTVNNEYKEVLH